MTVRPPGARPLASPKLGRVRFVNRVEQSATAADAAWLDQRPAAPPAKANTPSIEFSRNSSGVHIRVPTGDDDGWLEVPVPPSHSVEELERAPDREQILRFALRVALRVGKDYAWRQLPSFEPKPGGYRASFEDGAVVEVPTQKFEENILPALGRGELEPFRNQAALTALLERAPPPPPADLTREEIDALQLQAQVMSRYRTLAAAPLLVANPRFAPGVASFIQGLGLPDDELAAVRRGVGERALTTPAPREEPTCRVAGLRFTDLPRPGMASYEGFAVERGPLATSTDVPGEKYLGLKFTDPERFLRLAATDEHLRRTEIRVLHVCGLNQYRQVAFDSSANGAKEADRIRFAARRLELFPPGSVHHDRTDHALRTGVLRPERCTEDCVPALLRLAKASRTSLDAISLGSGKSLRQRATELGLFARPRVQPLVDGDGKDPLARSTGADLAQRLTALGALTACDEQAPSFTELFAQLLELLERDDLAPLDWGKLTLAQREQLVEALTGEKHLGAAAVLAGLLVNDLPEATDPLWSAVAAGAPAGATGVPGAERGWAGAAIALSRLSSSSKAWVLEPLRATPPDFLLVPLRVELAAGEPLTASRLDALYAAWAGVDPAGALTTLVAFAGRSGEAAVRAVQGFLEARGTNGTLKPADVHHALRGPAGERYLARHLDAVYAAIERLRNADAVTREAAMATLGQVVDKVSHLAPEHRIIHAALRWRGYPRDLQRLTLVGEREDALPVEARPERRVEGGSIAQRLQAGRRGARQL